MSIGMIDAIVLTVLILSILFALYRGLVTELLAISSWILAGFGAIYSYTPMQKVMHGVIENEKLAGLCGAALVALVILIIMTLINAHINVKLRQSSLSGLDRLLGMIFGVVRAVLLMALLYMAGTVVFSEKALLEMESENVSMKYIRKTVVVLKKFVPKNVQEDLGLNGATDASGKPKKIGTDLKHDHKLPEKSHKKALKKFVNDIKQKPDEKKKETPKKEEAKKGEKAKTDKPAKPAEKPKAKVEKQEKTQPKPTPEKTPAAGQYDKKERQSMDNLVEQMM